MMRTYLLHSMGDDFGPFSFEHVRSKLAAHDFNPSQAVSVVEDGVVIVHHSRLQTLDEFRDAAEQSSVRTGYGQEPE